LIGKLSVSVHGSQIQAHPLIEFRNWQYVIPNICLSLVRFESKSIERGSRPGGAGNIGTEAVVRSPPDGYTLLMIDVSPAINATLFNKLNFDFIRDIAPVANIVRVPNVMVVNPAFPAKTAPEFLAYAKANPGKISLASAGIGTPNHLSGELFKAMADIDMAHVPYRAAGPR